MKKKAKEKLGYRGHVGKLCRIFRIMTFCGEYAMSVDFSDKLAMRNDKEDDSVDAIIKIDATYLDFRITFYPSTKTLFDTKQYYDLAETILHEFCHLLTEPLAVASEDRFSEKEKEWFQEINERQTQRICNALMRFVKKSDYIP